MVSGTDRSPRLNVHYVLVWNDFSSPGVLRKVQETVRVWTGLGVRVRTSLVSRDSRAFAWAAALERSSHSATADAWMYRSPLTLNPAMRSCLTADSLADVDIVFSRFDLFLPALAAFGRHTPVVLEVNSHLHQELAGDRSASALYKRATFGFTASMASGITFVSHELSASPQFHRYCGARAVIANGVDLSSFPLDPIAPPTDQPPRVVFIGSPNQAWHGVDKILTLAHRRRSWRFDIIGQEAPSNVSDNVTFHGVLQREAYEPILRSADVAIGTMALHRKGMHEASPLKVREYLAMGIPTIIGYEDTDLRDGADWLLVLPNVETNVADNVEHIERFVTQWRGRRVPRSSIAALDMQAKEEKRIAFFRDVIGKGGGVRSPA